MKKMFLLLPAVFCAGLILFSSCKKEPEQSELNFENIEGKASISGRILYNAGCGWMDDAIVFDVLLPAVEQTVMVQVSTSDYVSSADPMGKETFTAVTDSDGRYTIEIPVGSRLIDATVSVVPFRAAKYFYISDTKSIAEKDVLYNKDENGNNVEFTQGNLSQGKHYVVDFTVFSEEELDVTYTSATTVTGKVVSKIWKHYVATEHTDAPYYRLKPGADYYTAKEKEGLDGVSVNMEVLVTDLSGDTVGFITQCTRTNTDGIYEFPLVLPVGYTSHTVSLKIKAEPYRNLKFTHWYCYNHAGDMNDYDSISWKNTGVDVVYEPVSMNHQVKESEYLTSVLVQDIELLNHPVDRSSILTIPGIVLDTVKNIYKHDPLDWESSAIQ